MTELVLVMHCVVQDLYDTLQIRQKRRGSLVLHTAANELQQCCVQVRQSLALSASRTVALAFSTPH